MSPRRRRKKDVETLEYIEFARRIIRAAADRVAEADEFELYEFYALHQEWERGMRTACRGWLRSGRTWTAISAALGFKSRQAARQRFGPGLEADEERKAP